MVPCLAEICTYLMIVIGVSYSLYPFGGITAFSQVLEIGVTIGFLLGSFLLAKRRPSGWLLDIMNYNSYN
ncbi:hypothetical protein AGMMS4952_26050 [Spirochaetia bacterium]|nr:hypothetical protein AGMMS4952_26050 [Spirochaetia bacterium]